MVDLLLVIIEHFSLGVMAEVLRAIVDWKSAVFARTGSVWPKISGTRVALTNRSLCRKTSWSIFHIPYKNVGRSFFCFITMHALDRQADRFR